MLTKIYKWLTISNTFFIIVLIFTIIITIVTMRQTDNTLRVAIEKESMIRSETDKMIFEHIDQVKKSVNEITVKIKKIEEKIIDKVKVTMPIPPKPRKCIIPSKNYHDVVKGDTLFEISLVYCINLEELIDINKELLTKNNMIIYPGDKIKLYWY